MSTPHALIAALGLAACLACGKGARSGTSQPPPPAQVVDLSGQVAVTVFDGGVYGLALPGLSATAQAQFEDGLQAFKKIELVDGGLGPVYNDQFCSSCHDAPPAIGGTNQRLEHRFGHLDANGNFDPLTSLGGPLLHDHGIGAVPGYTFVAETIPAQANVVTARRTQAVFGLGLVDATPDATFRAVAAYEAANFPSVAGRAATVLELATGQAAVGKFGWKAAVPTLQQFAGDAALNEMGITSPLFPNEVCPQGDCSKLAYDPRPDINDAGGTDVARFAQFMRLLGPPPVAVLGDAALAGQTVFASLGCAVCHLPLLVTGPNGDAHFDRVAYFPYSDFLLHDMGALGDGIGQGDARPTEMRTQPLWGVSQQTRLLHDGSASTVSLAIAAHQGQGAAASAAFAALSDTDRAALLAFLAAL